AEKARYELGAAVRLVAARKAAGQDYHLAARYRRRNALHALCHIRGAEVADDEYLRLRAGTEQGARRVVLAVRAGEDGDERPGPRRLHRRGRAGDRRAGELFHPAAALAMG